MARIDNLTNFLTDVAESIRTKKGTTDKISPSNFDTEIESIETGASFEMNDTSYLFYNNARVKEFNNLEPLWNNISHLYYMFYGASNLDKAIDLSNKISDNLTNTNEFESLFSKCSKIPSIKISNNNTKQTTLSSMFSECSMLKSIDLTNFNTDNVTNISYMFSGCKLLENIPKGFTNLNLSKVSSTYMNNLFYNCASVETFDLSNMNFPNVTTLNNLFNGCENAKTIVLPKFASKKITSMNGLFGKCNNLNTVDFNSLDTSKVNNVSYLFGNSTVNTNTEYIGSLEFDLSDFDFSSLTNPNNAMNIFLNNKSVKKINLSFLSNITYTGGTFGSMFKNTSSLVEIDLTPIKIDKSSISSYGYLFENCVRLTNINNSDKLQSSNKLTNIKHMFYNCMQLKQLDISGLDTTNVKDDNWTTQYDELFYNCQSLGTLDISNFVIHSSVRLLNKMFYGCVSMSSLLLPDFSNITTTSLNCDYMFYQVGKNNDLCDITNLNTIPWSKVSSLNYMFSESTINQFPFNNTSEILITDKPMQHMFDGCTKLTTVNALVFGPLSSYTRTGNYSYLFANCTKLESIDISNMYNKYEGGLVTGMFQNCTSLKHIKFHHKNGEFIACTANYNGAPDYMFDGCSSLETLDLRYFVGSTGDRDVFIGFGKCLFRNCRKLRKLDLRGGSFGMMDKGSSGVQNWATKEDQVLENCGVDNDSPTIVYVDTTRKQQSIIDLADVYNLGWSTENVIVVENPEEEVDMS